MTDEHKEIMEDYKIAMISANATLYKASLAKALDSFPKHCPELIEQYGSILVNSIAAEFKKSWIYVAENMQVQTLSREIEMPIIDETKVIV
jgi:hypothetical protein